MDNGALVARSHHWTTGFSAPVTRWHGIGRLDSVSKKHFVVPEHCSCYIGHASIAHFDIIFLQMLYNDKKESVWQAKKNLAIVTLYMLAAGWVKSYYVLLSGFPLMGI